MRQIGTFRPPIGCGEQTASADHERVVRVWLRMTEFFGKRWVDAHGEKPTEWWARAIHALTNEQIATGLARMLDSGLKHPPGLPEFVSLCKDEPKAECRPNSAMYRERFKPSPRALEHNPKEAKEHAKQRIERNAHHARQLLNLLKGVSA